MRNAVFNLFAALWLLGFGFAAVTAGAPLAVAAGSVGLLGLLCAIAARLAGQPQPPRHYRSR